MLGLLVSCTAVRVMIKIINTRRARHTSARFPCRARAPSLAMLNALRRAVSQSTSFPIGLYLWRFWGDRRGLNCTVTACTEWHSASRLAKNAGVRREGFRNIVFSSRKPRFPAIRSERVVPLYGVQCVCGPVLSALCGRLVLISAFRTRSYGMFNAYSSF